MSNNEKNFSGIYAVVVTPFKKDGSFDLEAAKRHLDWLSENGIKGVCLLGATGEYQSITNKEHIDYITLTKGLLAAGLIGVFIAEQATFAAEVAGCQAECGVGSAMAAAAVVQMMGGSVAQCVDAASMAMQSITGLVCDPVANRVEVPCLGKNIMGGVNAIAAASMILAGYDKVIPLDETILAMYDIGQKLPQELRCTFGGLGKTKTSCELCKRLG